MPVRFRRRYRFSASHLYRRPEWSEEKNLTTFGKCSNVPGHGHNYRLWVTVEGEVAAATGFVVDLVALDELVRTRILERLDHHHLNSAVQEFAPGAQIPTSENLVLWIREQLEGQLSGCELVGLRVDEDDDLGAEWVAG